jgi:transcriptional regulator GlxA family with amidase domain
MTKKVAVLVVNPVNGFGLFQYLETFVEKGILYKTFAVADTTEVKTNSGISIKVDAVVGDLIGHEGEYDALVFACGDAMPKFAENADRQYNQEMLMVIKGFNDLGKILIGHCAAAMIYDNIGIGKNKKVALHPYLKPHVMNVIGTDEKFVVDGNFFTAQTENTISELIPEILKNLT